MLLHRGPLWRQMRRECGAFLSRFPAYANSSQTAAPVSRLSYTLLETLVAVPQSKLLLCMIEKNLLKELFICLEQKEDTKYEIHNILFFIQNGVVGRIIFVF